MIRFSGAASGGNSRPVLAISALTCLLALGATGCLQQPSSETDTSVGNGTLTGAILNLISHIRISGDQPFTVVYSASPEATNVTAFYVEVESTNDGAAEIGGDMTFATGLPTGDNQTVTLNVGDLPLGIYRIGLSLVDATGTTRVLSVGTLEIAELPSPMFSLPNQNLAVLPGTAIDIRATVGDPENAVQWRLFYTTAGESTAGVPADEIGQQITIGTANEAIATWNTGGIALGAYRVGISVTDTGQSIAAAVEAGADDQILTVFNEFTIEFVATEPPPQPPSVVVNQPSSNRDVLENETVVIEYTVTVFEGPPDLQTIDVFFDSDGVADTGDERIISADLPISTQGVAIEGNAVFAAVNDFIADGETVYFGVTANDAKNAPVTRYAKGRVTRVTPADATLAVSQPSSPANRDVGEVVSVSWQTTDLPMATDATYSVLVRRVDDAGSTGLTDCSTNGTDYLVNCVGTTGVPLTQTTWSFNTFSVGRFRVSVQLIFADSGTPTLEERAPALVSVSTLPTVIWLGDVAAGNGTGAVFDGVQFEDNAGSAFAGAEDFDGDQLDDIIIVSRYGKPEFVNPTGIGSGEAYVIRGGANRYSGVINLNQVASESVPGFVISGIQALPSNATDGMASVFISDDADGDGIGEIVVGFPFAESQPPKDIGQAGFLGEQTASSCDKNWKAREPFYAQDSDDVDDDGDTEELFLAGYAPVPQFRRGGVVVISSMNNVVSTSNFDWSGTRIRTDLVGQIFEVQSLRDYRYYESRPEPHENAVCSIESPWFTDSLAWVEGDCNLGGDVGCFLGSDGSLDTLKNLRFGFDRRLADPWGCVYLSSLLNDPTRPCLGQFGQCPSCDNSYVMDSTLNACDSRFDPEPLLSDCTCDILDELPLCSATRTMIEEAVEPAGTFTCDPQTACTGDEGLCQCSDQVDKAMETLPIGRPIIDSGSIGTGYYVMSLDSVLDASDTNEVDWNDIRQVAPNGFDFGLVGCRIVGRNVNDGAGTSITQSGTELILASPYNQDDVIDASFDNSTDPDDYSSNGGNGYFSAFNPYGASGQGSPQSLPRLWFVPNDPDRGLAWNPTWYNADRAPGAPHQYLAGGMSHNGVSFGLPDYDISGHFDVEGNSNDQEDGATRIIGDTDELIERIVGIPDFNEDRRPDIAIGAPRANIGGDTAPDGAVYIIYRRALSNEGNFRLRNLKLKSSDSARLSGLLVRESFDEEQRFGESIAGGFDFDHDGVMDVAVGNPDGNGGTGEVVIIFGSLDTISQENGIPVEDEPSELGLLSRRQGARITGFEVSSEFGLNVANIGDVDGDGFDELAIAAPNATPTFDGNPSDGNDSLDPTVNPFALPGLDRDLDGIRDDVSGTTGQPNGSRYQGPAGNDDANDHLRHAGMIYVIYGSTFAQNFTSGSGPMDISINKLGSQALPGFIVVGRRGDRFSDLTDTTLVYQGDFLGGGNAGRLTETLHGNTIDFGGNTDKTPVDVLSKTGTTRTLADGSTLQRDRGRGAGLGAAGHVDGDSYGDFLIGAILADPRVDPVTGEGVRNGGEAYLIYGFEP